MNTETDPLNGLGRATIETLVETNEGHGMRWGRLTVTGPLRWCATGRLTAQLTVYPPGTTAASARLANLHRALWSDLGVGCIAVVFGISQALLGVWVAGGAIAAVLVAWCVLVIPRTADARRGSRSILATATRTAKGVTIEGLDELRAIGHQLDLIDAQLARGVKAGSPDLVRFEYGVGERLRAAPRARAATAPHRLRPAGLTSHGPRCADVGSSDENQHTTIGEPAMNAMPSALLTFDSTGFWPVLLDPWGNPVPEWMIQAALVGLFLLFALAMLGIQASWEASKDREFDERAARLGYVKDAKPEQHTAEPAPPVEPLPRMPLREIIAPDGFPAGSLLGAFAAVLFLTLPSVLNGWSVAPEPSRVYPALGIMAGITILFSTLRLIRRRSRERRSARAAAMTGAGA